MTRSEQRLLGGLAVLAGLWLLPVAAEAREAGDPPRDVGPRRMRFERLTTEEGLSQGTVNCLLQDSSGLLWIGTQGGAQPL